MSDPVEKIFSLQGESGFWKQIPKDHKYYPLYLHYVPNFKATLWTLILLADLKCDRGESRIRKPLGELQKHFFDGDKGIFSLGEDHFPIPCLNGNMIYLDCYFNGGPGPQSRAALDFFTRYQRFDDGEYEEPKNSFCSNKSCYGRHSCYWGVVKLLKGISFIPHDCRTDRIIKLKERCVSFILKHRICFSSGNPEKLMIQKIDRICFPDMYKSDFLEILWLLKRESVQSERIGAALDLLRSKRNEDGTWNLERKNNNMTVSVGSPGCPNRYVTERASEVTEYYS